MRTKEDLEQIIIKLNEYINSLEIKVHILTEIIEKSNKKELKN